MKQLVLLAEPCRSAPFEHVDRVDVLAPAEIGEQHRLAVRNACGRHVRLVGGDVALRDRLRIDRPGAKREIVGLELVVAEAELGLQPGPVIDLGDVRNHHLIALQVDESLRAIVGMQHEGGRILLIPGCDGDDRDALAACEERPHCRSHDHVGLLRGQQLVHAIERYNLDHLPGSKTVYSGRTQLQAGLATLLKGHARVAMEYSHNCNIPYVSRVDGGTIELIRSLGVDVLSSGDLIQQFEAKLVRNNEVMAELMEAHTELKKSLGEP